ncbi:MAG: AMP-binding protein, partial [bacterium]|nr:AMP-binding protein [bacterium]
MTIENKQPAVKNNTTRHEVKQMNQYSQHKAIAANENTKEKEYWQKKLAGHQSKAAFFTDYQTIQTETTGTADTQTVKKTAQQPFQLTDQIYTNLMQLSKESPQTLHIILSAALTLLLHKYTELDEIIIGTPIYRQKQHAAPGTRENEAVGTTAHHEFINTLLPLKGTINKDMSFKDLLLQMRATLVEAVENQNYPIEALPQLLEMESTTLDFPLFDVLLLLENIHEKEYIQPLEPNMVFSFKKEERQVEGTVEYNAANYKATTIDGIVTHFKSLLQTVTANVNLKISHITLLSEQEKQMILFEFNATAKEIPREKCYHRLFEEQVTRTPEKIAAQYAGRRATYSELNKYANRISHHLSHLGIDTGSIVGLYMKPYIHTLATIIAIFKTGAAYLPIDAAFPEEREKYILQNSGMSLLVTGKETTQREKE